MKIALFRDIGSGYETVWNRPAHDADNDDYCPCKTYTRVSEWMDVEFVPLPADTLVGKQLATLDATERDLRAQFQLQLNDIAEARSKLLALTHQEAAA